LGPYTVYVIKRHLILFLFFTNILHIQITYNLDIDRFTECRIII
jgi:hypothetical protein